MMLSVMHTDDSANPDRMTWRVEDPVPGVDLAAIAPISLRSLALLARRTHLVTDQNEYYRLTGAIDITEGLEYHHSNWLGIVNECRAGSAYKGTAATHEIIAYFNRLGQFHYFATSSYVRTRAPDAIASLQEISRLIPFRHKIAAHRSIDRPRPGDQRKDEQRYFAVNKGCLLITPQEDGCITSPSPSMGKTINEMKAEILNHGMPAYQLSVDPQTWIEFAPERDHVKVMDDCFSLFSQLLNEA
jgi:hypothetical protein